MPTRAGSSWLRIIGAALAAALVSALLGGCSAIQLGYANAPQITYWWLDGYVDFTDAQAPKVREELERVHQWHRANELPRIADMLARMDRLAGAELSPQQACSFVTDARDRMDALQLEAEPAAVALAQTVTRAQIEHLDRKYRTNREKYAKEWVEIAPEKLREKRLDQLVERVEMIYGRLEDSQRAALRDLLAQSAYDPRRNLAEMQRRHQDSLRTLARAADRATTPAQARDLLRGLYQRSQYSPDPAYRDYQEAMLQEGCRAFSVAHNAASASQRETASRRLRAYERDFRAMAAKR